MGAGGASGNHASGWGHPLSTPDCKVSPAASPSQVLADLERAHAFLGLAIAQVRHGAGAPQEWAAALHHFRAYAGRALDELNRISAAAATMDKGATAPAGRA